MIRPWVIRVISYWEELGIIGGFAFRNKNGRRHRGIDYDSYI